MSKNYKERLRAHRKRILKMILSVSALPLFLVILLITVFILGEAPEEWKIDNVLLSEIGNTTVYNGNTGSKTVAQITVSDGRRFVLSQMKPNEAQTALKIGEKYTIVYSSEFTRLYVKGLHQGSTEIVSKADSIGIYKSNRTSTIVFCSVCLFISIALSAISIKFYCKEETKQIRKLKQKLNTHT